MEPLADDYRALIVGAMLRAGHLRGLELLRCASSEYRISVGAILSPTLTWLRVGSDTKYEWHARSNQWSMRTEMDRSRFLVGPSYNEIVDIPLHDNPAQTLQVVLRTTERTGPEMEEMVQACYFHATFGLAGGRILPPCVDGRILPPCVDGAIEFEFVELPVDHVVDSRFDAFTGPLGSPGTLFPTKCLSCPNENHPWIRYLLFVTATPDIPPYALVRMIRASADRPWAPMRAERMLVEKHLHLMREIVADVSGAQPRLLLRWMPGAEKIIEHNDASFDIPMPSYPVA